MAKLRIYPWSIIAFKTLLRQQAATRAMDAFIARLREQYSADIEINTEALAEV